MTEIRPDTNSKHPKVSVCVITYNQEEYIEECLTSLLTQETEFEFEIIVGDDCSTDRTREIITILADRHPGIIRPFFFDEKIGGTKNYIYTHNAARGLYVAHLDGDDVALQGKLQKQAEYLDANDDCTVVWHRVFRFNDRQGYEVVNSPDLSVIADGKVTLSDALSIGNVFYHSSMMYRAKARKTREASFEVIDWYYVVEYLMSGYGKYLDVILGKYRVGDIGLSRGRGRNRTRRYYAMTMQYYLMMLPNYKEEIFTNSLINLIIELKDGGRCSIELAKLVVKSICIISPQKLLSTIIIKRRLTRLASNEVNEGKKL